MRKGVLAGLTALLIGHESSFAQPYPSCPAVDDARPETFGLQGSGEYLMWWFKNSRVPPLVTAGGNGKLGAPGTRVLVDDLNFASDVRQGGRFALGYHAKKKSCLAVDANFFFLSDRRAEISVSSSGEPLLAQPFSNIVTGVPDANLIAKTGEAAGTVTIGARTWLWGAEANVMAGITASDKFHVAAISGFRYLRLEDGVTSDEQFQVAPEVPGFGGSSVHLSNEFQTINRFYGVQLGVKGGAQVALLLVDLRATIAAGQMRQVANVNGVTNALSPNGSRTTFQGGLFALRSNSGRHQRDELAYIPEINLSVGLRLPGSLKLYAGYSFLWVDNVARAGEQIDPVINTTQFPIRSGNGPLVGPARPAFSFNQSDFWTHGLSFGLELTH